MIIEELIFNFFSKKYETSINEKMLVYSYEFPLEEVTAYIDAVNNITIEEYLHILPKYGANFQITAKDVFQFSNFTAATTKICEIIKRENNPGVSFLQAGKLLLQNDIERNKVAYIKYGENQLKFAESLGLIFEMAHIYFLSCLGYTINAISQDTQKKLILRCLLRNKLISKLFLATNNGDVNLRQFLYMLSDSTYNRRVTNLLHIFKIMNDFEEYDFSSYFSKINR